MTVLCLRVSLLAGCVGSLGTSRHLEWAIQYPLQPRDKIFECQATAVLFIFPRPLISIKRSKKALSHLLSCTQEDVQKRRANPPAMDSGVGSPHCCHPHTCPCLRLAYPCAVSMRCTPKWRSRLRGKNWDNIRDSEGTTRAMRRGCGTQPGCRLAGRVKSRPSKSSLIKNDLKTHYFKESPLKHPVSVLSSRDLEELTTKLNHHHNRDSELCIDIAITSGSSKMLFFNGGKLDFLELSFASFFSLFSEVPSSSLALGGEVKRTSECAAGPPHSSSLNVGVCLLQFTPFAAPTPELQFSAFLLFCSSEEKSGPRDQRQLVEETPEPSKDQFSRGALSRSPPAWIKLIKAHFGIGGKRALESKQSVFWSEVWSAFGSILEIKVERTRGKHVLGGARRRTLEKTFRSGHAGSAC
ncbi:hypothetical protein KSP40_PGU017651 [Platanthera guangdongensis]|uniref:Uncharacterized protein n=1 Tax=Platanthera guangdongensis TaxID=2320717 RepID=A0ABR2MYK8_9ASPA